MENVTLFVRATINATFSSGYTKELVEIRVLYTDRKELLENVTNIMDFEYTVKDKLFEIALVNPFPSKDLENFIRKLSLHIKWINEKVEEGWELEFYI